MEFLFIIAALVAVKHFFRVQPKSFAPDELPAISQRGRREGAIDRRIDRMGW